VAADDGDELVELNIVGESHHQDTLQEIAGPKRPEGKRTLAGVTLRCEPENPYDANAIRVEVLGHLLAHVARDQAAILSPAITRACGGVIEARGLVVGGWKVDGRDAEGRFAEKNEGHFGIRVWLTTKDCTRLDVDEVTLDPSLRPRLTYPAIPPAANGERRMSATRADVEAERYGSTVTVVNEEHYQATIVAAMPPSWDDRTWPLLVELGAASANPHAKQPVECIVVRIGNDPVGYFTSAMSTRHLPAVSAACADAERVTAEAHASQGTKSGKTFWRLKVEVGPR
jgi:hypothetical protein